MGLEQGRSSRSMVVAGVSDARYGSHQNSFGAAHLFKVNDKKCLYYKVFII